MRKFKVKSKMFKDGGFTPTPVFVKLFRRGETAPFAHPKNRCRGFTLIEMLVAITVLLLSITGPLTIAAQAVFSANIAKDRLTAAYLAQEGIELVRYLRDDNSIQGNEWLHDLDECMSPDSCILGPGLNPTPRPCNGECAFLRYRDDISRYVYSPVEYPESIFRRTIFIDNLSSGDMEEIRVTSEVEWRAGGRTHQVVLTENLFNWR
jgi:prepilin-type N-terminal cleavage/methylation domain-containing protein